MPLQFNFRASTSFQSSSAISVYPRLFGLIPLTISSILVNRRTSFFNMMQPERLNPWKYSTIAHGKCTCSRHWLHKTQTSIFRLIRRFIEDGPELAWSFPFEFWYLFFKFACPSISLRGLNGRFISVGIYFFKSVSSEFFRAEKEKMIPQGSYGGGLNHSFLSLN